MSRRVALFFLFISTFCLLANLSYAKNNISIKKLESEVKQWREKKEKTVILDNKTLRELKGSTPRSPQKTKSDKELKNIENIKSHLKKGNSLFLRGDYLAAKDSYDAILAINPEDSMILRKSKLCYKAYKLSRKAMSLYKKGEYQSAVNNFKEVLLINNKDKTTRKRLLLTRRLHVYRVTATNKFDQGAYNSALNWYKKVLEYNPDDDVAKVGVDICEKVISAKKKGKQLFYLGDYQAALDSFNIILSLNSKDKIISNFVKTTRRVINHLANAESEFDAGNYINALKYSKLAQELNPNNKAIKKRQEVMRIAIKKVRDNELYASLGEYHRIIDNLKDLKEINPENSGLGRKIDYYTDISVLKGEALSFYEQENFENVILKLEKILSLNPNDNDAKKMLLKAKKGMRLRNLGQSLLAMGRYSDAESVFQRMRRELILEKDVKTIVGGNILPGEKLSFEVVVSTKIKPAPVGASVTLLEKKKYLRKEKYRTWRGFYNLPKDLKNGKYVVKTRVALSNKKILTSFCDIRIGVSDDVVILPPRKYVTEVEKKERNTVRRKFVKKKLNKNNYPEDEDWLF